MLIEELITKARQAVKQIADYDQKQVDQLLLAIAKKIADQAEPLAKLAVDETRLGCFEHKIGKNQNMAKNIYGSLKGQPSVGVLREIPEKGLIEIAHPIGVIGSITPTTNPTITPLGNGLMALKGKNALIVSPHPRAKKTTQQTIGLMREALTDCGAPADLFQVIPEPSIEYSRQLMEEVDLIVATGGPGLVKTAYSSGKPAYGVGPGNVQAILDRDFDVTQAAEFSVIGRAFDNGIVCACQQSLFYPNEKEAAVFAALEKAGATVYSTEKQRAQLREVLFPAGKPNPELIGKDSATIANAAGLDLQEQSQILAVKVEKIGAAEWLCKEKLAPVLILKGYDDFAEAVSYAKENLLLEGVGHSAGLFSHVNKHIYFAGKELPVSRLVVNQPTIDAGGAPTNGLNPTVSLGCGSWGNNILAENLTYRHLINIARIALPIEATATKADWD
ncbi:aldehyde dehydrogenase family protein [Enterococcus sp. CSURQ0835]|uniref:aldehyde dehydrogenase family protein n=1 Tax=Enterococcus sp. CSURQ0835 TaxID=2681394 RepID=UPI00135CB987|nr:aldehyde dehydrogenase family protein [Enterococcus sp. CSURQ0835]